jgi:hypothetical protein
MARVDGYFQADETPMLNLLLSQPPGNWLMNRGTASMPT